MRKRILFICGSLNQTTQMHRIAEQLSEHECMFTPYYGNTLETWLVFADLAEGTIAGNKLSARCLEYLNQHRLPLDPGGRIRNYDLVLTCSDLVIQKNVRHYPIVVVQEGMTDPEGFASRLVKNVPFLPRWIAGTSMTGISNQYQKFCVASEGYRQLFIRKGADPARIVVTGIPNFDDFAAYCHNDFPHRDYVLVCTTDLRETYRFERRDVLLRHVVNIAEGRRLIFKLHPNEKSERAIAEIRRYAPDALVYIHEDVGPLIANCSVVVTQYSSVTFIGLALGKRVYSCLDIDELERLMPIQNGGRSAASIARVCRQILTRSTAARSRPDVQQAMAI